MELEKIVYFQRDAISGKCGDPEKVTKTLLEYEEQASRIDKDNDTIWYQDHPIPTDPWLSKEIETIWTEIQAAIEELLDVEVVPTSDPWFIVNRRGGQTFPHAHRPADLAVVYWANVTENSGNLHFFPLGLGQGDNNSVQIEPKSGHFLIFGGDALHAVPHNASDQPRVSMSRNFNIVSQ